MKLLGLLVLVGLGWGILWGTGVRVNVMASLPYGVYRLHARPPEISRGLLVTLRTPSSVTLMSALHGWMVGMIPLLKPVAAIAGDVVCHQDGRLWVLGQDYGPVFAEANGLALPHAVVEDSCVTVPAGSVFLASDTAKSVDSRYFGLVSINDLRSVATPILVWK